METHSRTLKIKAFGIAREIFGGRELMIEIRGNTVGTLRQNLLAEYPSLSGLRSLLIAVNNEYADDHRLLDGSEEIAIIPPVSGG